MTNIFNDLNKLVNAAQKIDKMLTERPKTEVTTFRLSQKEIRMITEWFMVYENNKLTEQEIKEHNKLFSKFRTKLTK